MADQGLKLDLKVDPRKLAEARAVLAAMDPALKRQLDARIRDAARVMLAAAQANTTGLSFISDGRGGRSGFAERASETVAGLKIRKSSKGWRIEQGTRDGALAEFARDGVTPQGKALVAMLDAHFPAQGGRLMWAAVQDHIGEVQEAAAKAVEEVTAEANRKLGGVL